MATAGASSAEVDWSNLLYDLLGMIRSKVASARGRIRFAAVCRSWRAAASQHLTPPALPLLVLSLHDSGSRKKHLYCPEEDRVLRVPVPSNLGGTRFCGTYDGGWIAAIATTRSTSTLAIVNLFSGSEVALSMKQRDISWQGHNRRMLIQKLIFSEVPTSSSCILAALTSEHDKVALCRVGCPDGGWTIHGCDREEFRDVVFHHGELYGLTRRIEKLFKFDIGVNKDGAPVVTAAHPLDVSSPKTKTLISTYIFLLCGKLAIAVMTQWFQNHKPFFKVFELAVTTEDAHDYEWNEVHTLGNCALFLGQICSSRAVHVQADWPGVVQKNHIYYSSHRNIARKEDQEFSDVVYLKRSEHGEHIYCLKDTKSYGNKQIPLVGYYITGVIEWPMWCFPPDF